jgi:hypothetical protein
MGTGIAIEGAAVGLGLRSVALGLKDGFGLTCLISTVGVDDIKGVWTGTSTVKKDEITAVTTDMIFDKK